jgi:hypothetical protein
LDSVKVEEDLNSDIHHIQFQNVGWTFLYINDVLSLDRHLLRRGRGILGRRSGRSSGSLIGSGSRGLIGSGSRGILNRRSGRGSSGSLIGHRGILNSRSRRKSSKTLLKALPLSSGGDRIIKTASAFNPASGHRYRGRQGSISNLVK